MSLAKLLGDADWDHPIFKKLAPNDTGEAPGHQGGMVIPRPLRSYFPNLAGQTSPDVPTISCRIDSDLFEGSTFLGKANARYQYQTWGDKRSPESRLTDELGPLRNKARGGDLLLVQRHLRDLDRYRLTLVRQGTVAFDEASLLAGGRQWGNLGPRTAMPDSELRKR
jgi:putative restriction endonuclease